MLLQEIGQSQEPGAKTIIFVETKRKVENITRNIRRYGWPAVCMHGDKTQQERDDVLYQFKQGRASILVATDVAARGLGKYFLCSRDLNRFNGYFTCMISIIYYVNFLIITIVLCILSEALAESYCVLSDYCLRLSGMSLLHWIT